MLLIGICYSCSKENNDEFNSEIIENLTDPEASNLIIENKTYFFDESGTTSKYFDGDLKYDITFSRPLEYEVSIDEKLKSAGAVYTVKNPSTDEWIQIINFKKIARDNFKFFFITSESEKIQKGVLNSKDIELPNQQKCPWGAL